MSQLFDNAGGAEYLVQQLAETRIALENKIIEHAVAVNNVNALIVRNHAQALDIVNLTNLRKGTTGYDPSSNRFYDLYENDNNPDGSSRHFGRIQEDALSGPGFRVSHDKHAARRHGQDMSQQELKEALESFNGERREILDAYVNTDADRLQYANMMRENLTESATPVVEELVHATSSSEDEESEAPPPHRNKRTTGRKATKKKK